jgi:SecD/SecF fusion protein
MQNKGAIKIFAILLGLACVFYLSFTWVTRGVESDAAAYAEATVNSQKVLAVIKDSAKGNSDLEAKLKSTFQAKFEENYLDSMKKQQVYPLFGYTYEECKKNEINLGLDLRGGMNVTLEVSVYDIIKNLSNDSKDPAFTAALNEAQKNLGVNNNDDFIKLFEKAYNQKNPSGRLAPIFQSIENKSKITFNSSNEEVIRYIRERVDEAVANAEKTFSSRINRFGVAQKNVFVSYYKVQLT